MIRVTYPGACNQVNRVCFRWPLKKGNQNDYPSIVLTQDGQLNWGCHLFTYFGAMTASFCTLAAVIHTHFRMFFTFIGTRIACVRTNPA
ncbi:hypothetical protein DYBT9623_05560 [Dyadobacter sp. CECT 9623]|uniref:Uncharacterized protein n=1 Tax=Dyadobacter linearis TaxID=2823330 RepID=A0ABM8UYZ0_9BACT|nr:hypothetical protein DYBT9623_05560 [Dyadobacter sp. CECT 9623]